MHKKKTIIVFLISALMVGVGFCIFYIYINSSIIKSTSGVSVYNSSKGSGYNQNKFGVYIPEIYSSDTALPLIVASHGANGDGETEIKKWKEIAEKYGLIVVTPSYACATNKAGDNEEKKLFIKQEKEMLKEILKRVTESLNIERRFVMHTGFSGGGTPTWYIATSFPEYFTSFCFRSANFYGRDFSPVNHLVTWRDKPVYIFWSRDDNEVLTGDGYRTKIGEGQEALNFMKDKKFTKLEYKIFPKGGHISRREEAARWFIEEVVNKKKVDKL